jgi:hypothetical protein
MASSYAEPLRVSSEPAAVLSPPRAERGVGRLIDRRVSADIPSQGRRGHCGDALLATSFQTVDTAALTRNAPQRGAFEVVMSAVASGLPAAPFRSGRGSCGNLGR